MICEARTQAFENWLKRRWVNQKILYIGVKNRGSGMKAFRVML